MQSQHPQVPFQSIENHLRSINEESWLEDSRLPTVHNKNTTKRLIRSSPTQGLRSNSQEIFNPHRLEDENGDPIIIATTSLGTSCRDVSTAVPAFWQRGKRKTMERDEEDTENDPTTSPRKRAKLSDHAFDERNHGEDVCANNLGDRGDVGDASSQLVPLITVESNQAALIRGSAGNEDAPSHPIISPTPAFISHSKVEFGIAQEWGSAQSHKLDCGEALAFVDLTDDELYFNLTYGQSLEQLFLSGDSKSTISGGLLSEEYRKYADAITATDMTSLGHSRRHKTRARAPTPEKIVLWAQIYQPSGIQADAVAHLANETVQLLEQEEDTNPKNADSDRETASEAKTKERGRSLADYAFPYTTEIGDTIKRLIAEKNSTAARRYIPDDQNIRSARGVLETAKAIKSHNLVVEKSRKPGPRNEVHWCGYRARLIHGEWHYSTKPCYCLEGCNVGFSSWDIAVRHLKEKHYGMHIPRAKKDETPTASEEKKKTGSRKGKGRTTAGGDEEDLATDNKNDDN